ncbi:hypothetical protein T459_12245 [Capsicum annuum]|uniref:Uncharacterized protein n=1 Tax=Capsicum annuum TaxID=4072 RepID=A0A2G2ZP83_CAPAN|nr:hypothetical protein T459_12245 [Capsicum annuum]
MRVDGWIHYQLADLVSKLVVAVFEVGIEFLISCELDQEHYLRSCGIVEGLRNDFFRILRGYMEGRYLSHEANNLAVELDIGVKYLAVEHGIGIGYLEVELGIGIGYLEIELGIGIGYLEIKLDIGIGYLEIEFGIWIGYLEIKLGIGIGYLEIELEIELGIGIGYLERELGIEDERKLGADFVGLGMDFVDGKHLGYLLDWCLDKLRSKNG